MSRQYLTAARCVNAVNRGASFKTFCASQSKLGKTDYALAAETLKHQSILHDVLNLCGISAKSLQVDSGLLDVMLYELLLGKKKIQGGGQVKRKILEYSSELTQALHELMTKNSASHVSALLPDAVQRMAQVHRYLRINELKIDITQGYHELIEKFPLVKEDDLIPGLFALPSECKGLGEMEEVKLGYFVVQDKASCIPSQVLMDEWRNGDLVDACAAPGNKTSHMAALMFRKCNSSEKYSLCSIHAFEKSRDRFELLQRRIELMGASTIVSTSNADFLSIDWSNYQSVSSILLDPSCSGSGISKSLERSLERSSGDQQRLLSLRSFQLKALLHAMSCSSAEFIVYSTCSINLEENESVVAEALHHARGKGWRLIAPQRFREWERRGLRYEGLTEQESRCLIRCLPEDGMNGFFVALLHRDPDRNSMSRARVLQRRLWRPLTCK